MLKCGAIKYSLCVQINIRSHGTLQVGQSYQSIRTRSYSIRFLIHKVIGIQPGICLHLYLILAETIPEPPQTHTTSCKGMHHIGILNGKIVHRH